MTGIRKPLCASAFVHGMAQIGQIEDRHAEELEDGIGRRGIAVGHIDVLCQQLPVGLGQAAIGHCSVDDLVFAFAGLEHDAR